MCSCVEDTKDNRIKDFNKEREIILKKSKKLKNLWWLTCINRAIKIFLKESAHKVSQYFSNDFDKFSSVEFLATRCKIHAGHMIKTTL